MAEKARQMDAYSPEKPELAYVIAHTYKHQIWGLLGIKAQESKQPAVHTASLFFLWDQRERPDYLERSGEQKKLLSELLDLPTEPMDMDSIFGRLTERRNAFYDFAELAEVTPVPSGVPIAVPRADTLVTPGLLTDVVACAAEQERNGCEGKIALILRLAEGCRARCSEEGGCREACSRGKTHMEEGDASTIRLNSCHERKNQVRMANVKTRKKRMCFPMPQAMLSTAATRLFCAPFR